MKNLFDRDFFKFTIGFMLILCSSFAIMALSRYYSSAVTASVSDAIPVEYR